jgi:hypothetical protein
MTIYTYDILKELIEYTQNKNENLNMALTYLSHNNTRNYDDWDPTYYFGKIDDLNVNYIQEYGRCCCSHPIEKIFMIKNKHNNNCMIIGSKCINYFGDDAIKRRNELIDKEEGKVKCAKCKKTVSKTIVDKYYHEENIYHKKCYHNQNYKPPTKRDTTFFFGDDIHPPSYQPIAEQPIVKQPIAEQPIVKQPIAEQPILNINTIVGIGQYKGQPLSNLLIDKNYCDWIENVKEPSGKLKEIQNYLKKTKHTI